jgi:hypothetical protein
MWGRRYRTGATPVKGGRGPGLTRQSGEGKILSPAHQLTLEGGPH